MAKVLLLAVATMLTVDVSARLHHNKEHHSRGKHHLHQTKNPLPKNVDYIFKGPYGEDTSDTSKFTRDRLLEVATGVFTFSGSTVFNETQRQRFPDFVKSIQDTYYENDYHNFAHATHVMLNTFQFANQLFDNDCIKFTDEEKFALVTAALVHDAKHNGMNNAKIKAGTGCEGNYAGHIFAEYNQSEEGTEEAISPLESRSLAVYKQKMKEANAAAEPLFPVEMQAKIDPLISAAVLSTDIGIEKRKELTKKEWDEGVGDNYYSDNPKSRLALLTSMLRMADISATMSSRQIQLAWNTNLFHEWNTMSIRCDEVPDTELEFLEGTANWFFEYVVLHQIGEMMTFQKNKCPFKATSKFLSTLYENALANQENLRNIIKNENALANQENLRNIIKNKKAAAGPVPVADHVPVATTEENLFN